VSEVAYFHVEGWSREQYLNNLSSRLATKESFDVVAVSAGFDRHEHDWGGLLKTEDYSTIGEMIKEFAEENCNGRRYALLEGGYNSSVLGRNVRSLLDGLK